VHVIACVSIVFLEFFAKGKYFPPDASAGMAHCMALRRRKPLIGSGNASVWRDTSSGIVFSPVEYH